MPRVTRPREHSLRRLHSDLVSELAQELMHPAVQGQPLIEEEFFPRTGTMRVTVIWDQWAGIPDEHRYDVVIRAYEQAEGREKSDRVALVIALTVPEASEAGLLPYEVQALVRKDDVVTPGQCRNAMLEQGASQLVSTGGPVLRFATLDEAQACVERLTRALPGSEPVWAITSHELQPSH